MGRKRIKAEDERAFHLRMPRETWLLLKRASFVREMAMGDIVVELIEKQREKLIKKYSEIQEMTDIE